MKKTDLEKLKGSFYIYSNGEYVILSGEKLYILKIDGSLVACRKDLRHAGRITFLSGNRMLLCSSKAFFHMIDLCSGIDIWTAPYVKHILNVNDLAISPDESFAYTYDEYKGINFISRLCLTTQEHEVDAHSMYYDVGGTYGILCDTDGVPCLLKSLTETIGGKTVHQNGVRIHDFDGIAPGGTTTWKAKWSFDTRSAISFLGSTSRILTNDLYVYDLGTDTLTPLLEPEAYNQLPHQRVCACWPDSTGRYLCLKYQTGNVIVDTQTRNIAAQYAADYTRGCLIGNEYWICVNDRVCRKPFPAYEEIPPVKHMINMDWYFAEHPEKW